MWHTRSGFPRHPFGLRPRFSLVEGMVALAVIGIFCLIAVAAVTSVDSSSLGGPVIGAIGDHDDYAAARRAAESLGFTNVHFRNVNFPETLGCDAEASAYYAIARNHREQEVRLTICCGGFNSPEKGCSVQTR